MSDEPEETAGPRSRWRSTLVLVLAAAAVAHSLVVGLWLLPTGPVRDAAGPSRLAFYVNPYFQQDWDVLDPSAQRVDEALWIRARVLGGGDEILETDWVDVTAADLEATRGVLSPPRIRLAARRLATNLNAMMFDLGDQGRQVVSQADSDQAREAVESTLLERGVDAATVARYSRLDASTASFASMYLQAGQEARVVQVQYRVGRRTVPPREERDERRIGDEPFQWFVTGWRAAERGGDAAQRAFDDYVREG